MQTPAADADFIGIGTSPLMLLRAIALAGEGRRVLLLDRAALPGGAWAAPTLFGHANVENAAHLIENRPALHALLRDDLGIALAPDPCIGFLAGRRLSMGFTRIAFHAMVALKSLTAGEGDKARRLAASAMRAAASLGTPFLYPVGGSAALNRALLARLGALGGRVAFGEDVLSIHVERDGVAARVRLETRQSGEHALHVRTASRALMASRAFAPVHVGGKALPLETEAGETLTLILHVHRAGQLAFSYAEIVGDRLLKRLRDVSAFASPALPADQRLLCVQIRPALLGHAPADSGGESAGTLALEALKKLGLLPHDAMLMGEDRSFLRFHTLTNRALGMIHRATDGLVEALPTTDFADGFLDQQQDGTKKGRRRMAPPPSKS
ncbi:hypothetical protein ACUJ46_05010 [Sandaracinobacteroides sp. A072]|uniref:hypothetical protein n=1 Tax=Sandaracinobacteroides sp. A072 TaxID=3461146 RepID=UPI004041EEBD